jgi:hypothetical protein
MKLGRLLYVAFFAVAFFAVAFFAVAFFAVAFFAFAFFAFAFFAFAFVSVTVAAVSVTVFSAFASATVASGSVMPETLSYDYKWFDRLGICVSTRHSLRNSLIYDDVNLKSVDVECGTCGNDNASD